MVVDDKADKYQRPYMDLLALRGSNQTLREVDRAAQMALLKFQVISFKTNIITFRIC